MFFSFLKKLHTQFTCTFLFLWAQFLKLIRICLLRIKERLIWFYILISSDPNSWLHSQHFLYQVQQGAKWRYLKAGWKQKEVVFLFLKWKLKLISWLLQSSQLVTECNNQNYTAAKFFEGCQRHMWCRSQSRCQRSPCAHTSGNVLNWVQSWAKHGTGSSLLIWATALKLLSSLLKLKVKVQRLCSFPM